MRAVALCIAVLFVAQLTGCETGSVKYRMVAPLANDRPVYEDPDLRISVSVKDYSRFGLRIKNKTGGPLRVTWGNSCIITTSGAEEKIAYRVSTDRDVTDRNNITTIRPGATAVCDVYPASHVYLDKDGNERVYPLYYKGSVEGRPDDLKDRRVGVSLVMEVKDHARRLPVLVVVEPPVL